MSNREAFIELVKLAVTIREVRDHDRDWRFGVQVVDRAMQLPDWAPRVHDVREAGGMAALVAGFVEWCYRDYQNLPTPEWFFRAVGPTAAPQTGATP